MRGPEGCEEGLFHQMFVTYRVSSVSYSQFPSSLKFGPTSPHPSDTLILTCEQSLLAIVKGMPSRFASQDWRTIPFGQKGKTLLHHLVDIMLLIPLYLYQAGHQGPIDHCVLRIAQSDALPLGLERNYHRLLEQLERWWEAYESIDLDESEVFFTMASSKYKKVKGVDYSPTLFLQRDTTSAFTASLYNAASLIVNTILHAFSVASDRLEGATSPGNSKYHLKQAVVHSNSILEFSIQHQEQKITGMEFLRPSTVFPLMMVKMLSLPEQSMQATNLMKKFQRQTQNVEAAKGGNSLEPAHRVALHVATLQNAAMQNR
jgi:hypothetical protein